MAGQHHTPLANRPGGTLLSAFMTRWSPSAATAPIRRLADRCLLWPPGEAGGYGRSRTVRPIPRRAQRPRICPNGFAVAWNAHPRIPGCGAP